MNLIKTTYILALLAAFALPAYAQTNNDHAILGRSYAEKALNSILRGEARHNVIDSIKHLIKDSVTAVHVAEPILFEIYGKDHIIGERPYEVYLIDNYWVLSGTLPRTYVGGTFLIIIDSRDCKILRITHGK